MGNVQNDTVNWTTDDWAFGTGRSALTFGEFVREATRPIYQKNPQTNASASLAKEDMSPNDQNQRLISRTQPNNLAYIENHFYSRTSDRNTSPHSASVADPSNNLATVTKNTTWRCTNCDTVNNLTKHACTRCELAETSL